MAYALIQQTDTDNQYILYQYGNDIKINPKTKNIKKDSNIRKILISFSIPGSNTNYECTIDTFIQIKKNIKNKNHCIPYFTYIKCSNIFDKDNLYNYIKNNNVIFNIKYKWLFRNNYIYDEFEEHYDVKSFIDKINIKYEKNGKEHESTLNIFIQENEDYSEIFFNIVRINY
jgi:hypothetical protein